MLRLLRFTSIGWPKRVWTVYLQWPIKIECKTVIRISDDQMV